MTARADGPRRTPVMEQFFRAKDQHPDAILFFRMGDFYEMFFEDAVLASELLDITLTSRSKAADGDPIPMAGVPHHAATGYITRLLEKGQRVAICEQMEDPSKCKGVVPREVVRVITPGLVLDPDALDARAHNYLVALVEDPAGWGMASLELSTAEARACTLGDEPGMLAELSRLDPREILLVASPEATARVHDAIARTMPRTCLREIDRTRDDPAPVLARVVGEIAAADALAALAPAARRAAAIALAYAEEAQHGAQLGVQRIGAYDPREQLVLDEAAVRNLEIVRTLSGERSGSLLSLLDETRTAMGARLLRRRLVAPLTDVAAIRRRHDTVEALVLDPALRTRLRDELSRVPDLERLATRVTLGVATPRDLGAIRDGLRALERGRAALAEGRSASVVDDPLAAAMPDDVCSDVADLLETALVDEPPAASQAGGIFREHIDPRLDELRELSSSGKDVILELEDRERKRTGIGSLKVRYTKVFGYYIEITKSHLRSVPAEYRRKQTVAGGERFTTEELEVLAAKILNAEDRARTLETELFEDLRRRVSREAARVRTLAGRAADVDVHASFADIAHRYGYVRPEVDDSVEIDLADARHPIVEHLAAPGGFVPNDVRLDADGARMMIVTGPNMAGKSTTMRQVALAVILAQAGGFAPAARARIGVVDRVFTRVGASDNLAQGQSTFMVEMREAAAILRGATKRSLVVLDEIGRGTSTYDGLAIAWAIAEHLHDAIGCRTMFATHYHEICELAASHAGVANYNVAAREHGADVVFLHKLVPGGANRSYGVAVARLAGVPEIVLARARAILAGLEHGGELPSGARSTMRARDAAGRAQLDLFVPASSAPGPSLVEETLEHIDVDHLTPVEALVTLARLKEMLRRGG